MKGIPIFKVLSRTWIPLVILAVVVVGGFLVFRVHGYFGSEKRESYADSNLQNPKPFNPKRITYEVFGPPGTVADISYFDVNDDPQRVDGAALPWSLHITTDKAAVMGNLVARGNSDSIGCRILVDDVGNVIQLEHREVGMPADLGSGSTFGGTSGPSVRPLPSRASTSCA